MSAPELPPTHTHTHTRARARRHAQGITEGKQKKQPEMWTLGTELTLLGKQKVGSSVPRWVLGLAKSRVFASSFLCDTPTPLVPKVKQLQYKHQTPRHPFSCLWADAQGILQIGECFWGQGTKRKRLRSLPGWYNPQNLSTSTSIPPLCRSPERDRDLTKVTQQGSGGQSAKPTFPISWLGTHTKRRF